MRKRERTRWGLVHWVFAGTGSYLAAFLSFCLIEGLFSVVDMDGHDGVEEPIRAFVYDTLRAAAPTLGITFLASFVLFAAAALSLSSFAPGPVRRRTELAGREVR